MKKILLTACLFSFFIAVPLAQAMDHYRSDGRGGYYTNDGKHIRSDGRGGYYHPDGSHSRSDGRGGYYDQSGNHMKSDGRGGHYVPNHFGQKQTN